MKKTVAIELNFFHRIEAMADIMKCSTARVVEHMFTPESEDLLLVVLKRIDPVDDSHDSRGLYNTAIDEDIHTIIMNLRQENDSKTNVIRRRFDELFAKSREPEVKDDN